MNLLEIGLVALLATYRLTFLLNSEAGPADIFGRLRTRLGVRFDEHSRAYGTNWVAEGILCFMCLSVWVAFGVTVIMVIGMATERVLIAELLLLPFALSGGAVYLKKAVG